MGPQTTNPHVMILKYPSLQNRRVTRVFTRVVTSHSLDDFPMHFFLDTLRPITNTTHFSTQENRGRLIHEALPTLTGSMVGFCNNERRPSRRSLSPSYRGFLNFVEAAAGRGWLSRDIISRRRPSWRGSWRILYLPRQKNKDLSA